MVELKITSVSIVALLSVFLQPGIRAQPTIGSSSEPDKCSQPADECDFYVRENTYLQSKGMALESAFIAQMENSRRLTLELETKQQTIETLENASSTQFKENQRLELENKRLLIKIQPGNTVSTRYYNN